MAGAATAAGNANTVRFADRQGDATAGGMDITNVTAANDDAGKLTFLIEIPTHQTLPSEKFIGVYFDTDRNPSTGSSGGSEFLAWADGTAGTIDFSRWDTSTGSWAAIPGIAISGSYNAGVQRVDLNRSALGPVSIFDFTVYTWGTGSSPEDVAPDSGKWTYEIKIAQPSSRLVITGLTKTPDRPVAGQPFTVAAAVSRVGQPGMFVGKVQCRARVGARVLAGSGQVTPGAASCRWRIPADLGGKAIVGTITVTEPGSSPATRQFSAVITRRLTFSIVVVTTSPAQPRAGAQFYFGIVLKVPTGVVTATQLAFSTLTCRAVVAGKSLTVFVRDVRPRYGGDPNNIAIQCGWNVPHGASGKTMTGSMALAVPAADGRPGATFRHAFTRKIR
jgi:hypothetical protein